MKKLLTLSVAALAISAAPALADNHSDGKKGGMFAKHDTNGDGVISKSEFLAHAEERFATMDADGNGEVSKDEAKAGKEKMRERVKERREKIKEHRNGDDSAE